MTDTTQTRRKMLKATGVAAMALVAGCTDDDDDDGAADDGDDGAAESGVDAPDDVDDYLTDNDANLYDGTMADLTGEDEVTIDVGAGDDGYAYEPAAAQIDAGTTVVWEWTGEGGAHNVVSQEGDFEFENDGDGELIDDDGHTWEFTFDEDGYVNYHCEAHTALGHHGAIVVE